MLCPSPIPARPAGPAASPAAATRVGGLFKVVEKRRASKGLQKCSEGMRVRLCSSLCSYEERPSDFSDQKNSLAAVGII